MAAKEVRKQKDTIFVQRLSNEEIFAEAILAAGVPLFVIRHRGNVDIKDQITWQDKIVKPFPAEAYLNRPYSFYSKQIAETYITEAKVLTLDSLYRRVKLLWKTYVDADDFHISICSADTIFSYFQDKLGLTHYLFFVGGGTSGKSNRLKAASIY